MRNTHKIIESIIENTSFNHFVKVGLASLYEKNTDIIYWNALNEDEDFHLVNKVKDAFSKIEPSLKSQIAKPTTTPKFKDWVKRGEKDFTKVTKDIPKKSDDDMFDEEPPEYLNYAGEYKNLDVDMGFKKKPDDKTALSREEVESNLRKEIERDRQAYANAYYSIIGSEEKVGADNIKRYMEKISDDVQTFVNLVTLLVQQIIKEAWVNSPETIKKVYGKTGSLSLFIDPSKKLRNENIDSFINEAKNLLKLSHDLSVYLLLGDMKKEISDSLIGSWDDIKTNSNKKVKDSNISPEMKVVFDLIENGDSQFYNQLTDAVWESIPNLIAKHGDEFFLIIESENQTSSYDAFMSSGLRTFHPLFETLHEELLDKKPFNWLTQLENKLIDDREIDKNLSYCGAALVEQGIIPQKDYTFGIIGIVSGKVAHKMLQEAYKDQDGFSDLLGVKESLWITSSYVPGMYGLILLLMNVATGLLFVACAEDVIPFDMSKYSPEFTDLPIWQSFREGALDVRYEHKDVQLSSQDEYQQKRKERKEKSLKGGLIKKYFIK